MSNIEKRIVERLEALALDAFDPDFAEDSDGYDQAERAGLDTAIAVVQEEFAKEKL